jgi:RNA polymerase-binding transcription factor DksA
MIASPVEESLETAARRMLLKKWQSLSTHIRLSEREAQLLLEDRAADWEDQAASVATAERLESLAKNERLQLAILQAAIERLDNGTWGTCLVCGRPIAEMRLRLAPEATRCSRCTNHE